MVQKFQESLSSSAMKRKRCHEICAADPTVTVEQLTERLAVDERSILRWRAEFRAQHSRARPQRLPLRPKRLP